MALINEVLVVGEVGKDIQILCPAMNFTGYGTLELHILGPTDGNTPRIVTLTLDVNNPSLLHRTTLSSDFTAAGPTQMEVVAKNGSISAIKSGIFVEVVQASL